MSIITFEGLCTTFEASTNATYNTDLLLNESFWLYIQGTKMQTITNIEMLHLTFKAWNLQRFVQIQYICLCTNNKVSGLCQ